jgi:alpha-tubulin suppressor-like RCC1 family protein
MPVANLEQAKQRAMCLLIWLQFGQLGVGDLEDRNAPTLVTTLAGNQVTLLACGWRHTLAVTATGQVYTWGRGVNGQLGHGDEEDRWVGTPAT